VPHTVAFPRVGSNPHPTHDGEAKVEVTLLHRRALLVLMDQEGRDVPDAITERQELRLCLDP